MKHFTLQTDSVSAGKALSSSSICLASCSLITSAREQAGGAGAAEPHGLWGRKDANTSSSVSHVLLILTSFNVRRRRKSVHTLTNAGTLMTPDAAEQLPTAQRDILTFLISPNLRSHTQIYSVRKDNKEQILTLSR